jgi:hypothetical protein
MVEDLDLDLGRPLTQIRGIATTIHDDATQQPNHPIQSLGSRWTDLNHNPRESAPTGPD